ncbi:MAG: FAD-binding oxidoreductase [Candidatus Fermentibacteria bacterium]|nr:FAD-binding oxidoreductase [Candidatus Fermentibacteria bacterium]
MRTIKGTHFIQREHPELLKDESSLSGGNCELAAWPGNQTEAAEYMKECLEDSVPITVSGARTGITGGAIPFGGAVVSTELLKGIQATPSPNIIRVQAGETLDSVQEYCKTEKPGMFYPPDPTETTASIGGTIATNASGAGSYRYGSTRNWIAGLKVLLLSGREINIKRGDYRFSRGKLKHPVLGTITLPELDKPQPEKNAAGLYILPDMDLIDLFIGSDGKLGLISSADLILSNKPHSVASFAVFCNEDQFWELRSELISSNLPMRELEAMAETCLPFLEKNTEESYPQSKGWVLFTSIDVASEEELDIILETLEMILEEKGISIDNTWGGFDEKERKRLKELRHLLPETVNRIISNNSSRNSLIHKVSTDTAVPPEKLEEYYGTMKSILLNTGLEYVIFGHSGQGHLHANLIPENSDQMSEALRAVELISIEAVKLGGTVSAEHGTGKLKAPLLRLMYSSRELNDMNLLIQSISSC